MNASQKTAKRWFEWRGLKVLALGLAVAMTVALAIPDSAAAKNRKGRGNGVGGRGRGTVNTPYGKMPRYRPQLQIGSQTY
jgi:hypothetical protein